jgi:predicted transcriptional regulator
LPKSSRIVSRRELSSQREVLTPEHCRTARVWLGWSRDELARQADVSLRTIAAFERAENAPRTPILKAIRNAIESAGVRLLFDKSGNPVGVVRRDAEIDLSDDPLA